MTTDVEFHEPGRWIIILANPAAEPHEKVRAWSDIHNHKGGLVTCIKDACAQMRKNKAAPGSWREEEWWTNLARDAKEAERILVAEAQNHRKEFVSWKPEVVAQLLPVARWVVAGSSVNDDLVRSLFPNEGSSRSRAQCLVAAQSLRADASVVDFVPIAFVAGDRGFVAKLRLELLAGPEGDANDHAIPACSYHPEQSLTLGFDESFLHAMDNAWESALEGLDLKGFVGRWSVLPMDDAVAFPTELFKHPSISAAAARGWWHMLRGIKLDRRVLATGEVCRVNDPGDGEFRYELKEVGGVPVKVAEVCRLLNAWPSSDMPPVDRIAVMGLKNWKEADKAIAAAGMRAKLDAKDVSAPPAVADQWK